MKNRKYRLLSMGGFEMFQSWVNSIDHYDLADVYNLFVQFVKQSCNIDIAITKQRVYFYDKINGNQYYIQKKYIVELSKNEKYNYDTEYRPSLVFIESIYMDRKNNRKWINAKNLRERY
jgi:hypothetical protein